MELEGFTSLQAIFFTVTVARTPNPKCLQSFFLPELIAL
jgi:hypothetical protein